MSYDFSFHCDSHQIDGFNLSYLDSMDQNKPVLHFYHANGFPVSTYLPFLERLTDSFRVIGLGQRGQDSQTSGNISWHKAGMDLIDFLNKKKLSKITGVGHSIGAVATMFAAARRPDLFSELVLIDPVLLPYKYIAAMAFLRAIGKKGSFILAKRARGRKSSWKNRNEAYEYFKSKALFKNFNDELLQSYVTYGLKDADSRGVTLLCPPEAEAKIFENYPLDLWLWPKKLQTKTLVIKGENSDVLFSGPLKRFLKKSRQFSSIVVKDAGHLVPMEKPDEITDLIKTYIKH